MSARNVTPAEVVGAAVRRLRESAGLSQRELGERLALTGVGARWQSGVAALENGGRRIGLEEIYALALIFDVSPQTLLAVRPSTMVEIGGRLLTADQWHAAMRVSRDEQALLAEARVATKATRGRQQMYSLWDKVLRQKRENALKARTKYPGPTYVADRDVVLPVELAEAFEPVPLELKANRPWVARDRLEAEALTKAERQRMVRRIDRSEARRLRKRSGS